MTTYTGPTRDGPFAGKQQTAHHPSFTIAFCPPAPIGDPGDWDTGAVETIRHGTYEWHPNLHAWVWKGELR